MRSVKLIDYQTVNESFRKRFIYHAGIDCGFFVELNYMVNAMLYCLTKRYRFELYSEDANFGTGKGWTEYFVPFCEEVHEPFHHKYNLHRPPQWRRILRNALRTKSLSFVFWKLKFILKSFIGHWLAYRAYGEVVWLSQDVVSEPDKFYHIPALGLDCTYTEVYAMLAKMIWQPQPGIQQQISDAKLRLSLPQVYSGAQIRGGDKASEARLIGGWQIIQALHPQDGEYIFVLTDNYLELEIIRNEYPHLHIVSLCQPNETGYHYQAFNRLAPMEKKESIIRLIVSFDILLHCYTFVGTITSGPSVFLMKVRADDPCVTAIDCPQSMLPDCLTFTINERAGISRKFMKRQRPHTIETLTHVIKKRLYQRYSL